MNIKHVRRFELFLNAALVLAVVLIGATAVRRYFGGESANAAADAKMHGEIGVNKPLLLEGVDWEKNGKTVVLLLSEKCRYCLESVPFYQRLTAALSGNPAAKVVAVFPDEAGQSRKFLDGQNVRVDEVREASLIELGVKGTPTLALVDANGVVTDFWRGKLTPGKEGEVFERMNLPNPVSMAEESRDEDASTISVGELEGLLKRGGQTVLLDVRERAAYKEGHLAQAKNIPLDEVSTRAPNELPLTAQVIVYCRHRDRQDSKRARRILYEQGFRNVLLLRES